MTPSFYGAHGVASETLASGAPIPHGGYFEMSDEDVKDPHNQRLIEEGKIIPTSESEIKAVEKTAKKDAAAVKDAAAGEDTGDAGENTEGGEA